jgi:hypothetical protein
MLSANERTTIHQPSTINHQPSTINHQPSTINHQPSTINHQPSTINHQPSTINQVTECPAPRNRSDIHTPTRPAADTGPAAMK